MPEEKRPEFLVLLDELLDRLEGSKKGMDADTSTPRKNPSSKPEVTNHEQ